MFSRVSERALNGKDMRKTTNEAHNNTNEFKTNI